MEDTVRETYLDGDLLPIGARSMTETASTIAARPTGCRTAVPKRPTLIANVARVRTVCQPTYRKPWPLVVSTLFRSDRRSSS
jgi:hypothetical protein